MFPWKLVSREFLHRGLKMNPYPCGYYGNPKCKCTDYEVLKYRQKISGPISDRIDIQKYVQPVDFINLSNFTKFKYSARSFHKYLKVARTFADMEGAEKIRKKDILSALMARDMDKDSIQMTVIKG